MAATELEYRLTGSGWTEAALTIGSESVRLTASYLTDALADLLSAATALLSGATKVRVSWLEEPGEFRWILASDDNALSVRILLLDDWEHPDDQGKPVFSAMTDVPQFSAAVAAAAQGFLDDLGTEHYREKWVQHDFPLPLLRELQAALSL